MEFLGVAGDGVMVIVCAVLMAIHRTPEFSESFNDHLMQDKFRDLRNWAEQFKRGRVAIVHPAACDPEITDRTRIRPSPPRTDVYARSEKKRVFHMAIGPGALSCNIGNQR